VKQASKKRLVREKPGRGKKKLAKKEGGLSSNPRKLKARKKEEKGAFLTNTPSKRASKGGQWAREAETKSRRKSIGETGSPFPHPLRRRKAESSRKRKPFQDTIVQNGPLRNGLARNR